MKIIGIDPGVKFVGMAFSDKTTKTVTSEDTFGVNHLVNLANKTVTAINEFNPDKIIIEDYGYGGRFFNVKVAEFVGMLKMKLQETIKVIDITFVAPNTVKKIVTGNGKASKAEMKRSIKEIYPNTSKNSKTTHEFDAIGILHVGFLYYDHSLPREAEDKLISRTYTNV